MVHAARGAHDSRREREVGLRQFLGIEHEFGRRRDRADGRAEVVAEYGEEHFLGLVEVLSKSGDRFGERLIDRFVEARQIIEIDARSLAAFLAPESNDTRAQRPILGDHLVHGKPAFGATRAVLFGGGPHIGPRTRSATHRLFRLFVGALWRLEILGDHRQHLAGVVAERGDPHRRAGGSTGFRERVPLGENSGAILQNEIC